MVAEVRKDTLLYSSFITLYQKQFQAKPSHLQIFLSVENNSLGFNFPIFDVNFISTQDNWNVLAHTDKITVPVWNILIGYPGCDIKHDDGTLPLNVVAITKTAKLLLPSSIPNIESNWSLVGIKDQGMDFNSKGGCNGQIHDTMYQLNCGLKRVKLNKCELKKSN